MLEVSADVEIEFGVGRGRLVADGNDVVLDVDEPSALIGAIDRRSLRKLAEVLTRAGLTLHVRSGDRLLLAAGRDARPGVVSRLLRLPAVRLSPLLVLRTALGRSHPRP